MFQRRARATTLSPIAAIANTPTPTTTNMTPNTATVNGRGDAQHRPGDLAGRNHRIPAVEPDEPTEVHRDHAERVHDDDRRRDETRPHASVQVPAEQLQRHRVRREPEREQRGIGRDHEVRPRVGVRALDVVHHVHDIGEEIRRIRQEQHPDPEARPPHDTAPHRPREQRQRERGGNRREEQVPDHEPVHGPVQEGLHVTSVNTAGEVASTATEPRDEGLTQS